MFQFKNKLKTSFSQLSKSTKEYSQNTFLGRSFQMKPQSNFSRITTFFNNSRVPLYGYLIGANIAVFGLYKYGTIRPSTFIENFTLNQNSIQRGNFHTLLTYSFSHSNFLHLASNMIGLYFFGKFIENSFGSKTLLKLYLGGALLGGLFILAESGKKRNYNAIHLGASASVSAILTNFALNFPRLTVFFYFIPMPAWVFGVLLLLQSVVFYGDKGGISHSGHLGGIVFGGIAYALMRRGRF